LEKITIMRTNIHKREVEQPLLPIKAKKAETKIVSLTVHKEKLTAMAHVVEGQMKLADRLTAIEGELKLIRIEISELKEKIKK